MPPTTDHTIATEMPAPEQVITVRDFSIDVPTGFTGKGAVGLRNTGPRLHEVALLRLHVGKTLADGFAWYGSGRQGPAPFDVAGGLGTVTPGREAWATMDLPAGRYVAVCFLPDRSSGRPHAVLGMVKPFTIA